MLTASTNLMQEEWVQRWLHKLTPKQKALVTEVLEDCHKYRNPSQAAVEQADTLAAASDRQGSRINRGCKGRALSVSVVARP
jgi:hypothetical protein